MGSAPSGTSDGSGGSLGPTAAEAPRIERTRSRRSGTAMLVAAVLVVPAVAAYAVLWIGGAIEILTYEDSSPGTSCIVATSISSTEVGEEQDRWIGGGLLWRPGVVCAVRAPSDTLETTDAAATPPTQAASPPAYRYEDRRLTQADVLSALFAALTVAIVAVVVEQRLARRR